MSNAISDLGMGHFLVNLKDEQDIYDSLSSLLEMDNDLIENKEYFRDDTLELGFETESNRIVKEALKELGSPTTSEEFEVIANQVFGAISDQDYFGACELSVTEVSEDKISVAYSYGGNCRG